MLQQLPDAGTNSEALSSACAQTCWVSGHADGKVALWHFALPAPPEPLPATRACPHGDRYRRSGAPRTIMSGDWPGVVFSHAGST